LLLQHDQIELFKGLKIGEGTFFSPWIRGDAERGYILFPNRVPYTCRAEALLPELFKGLEVGL